MKKITDFQYLHHKKNLYGNRHNVFKYLCEAKKNCTHIKPDNSKISFIFNNFKHNVNKNILKILPRLESANINTR